MEKPLKPTNTVEQYHDDRVRGQRAIDLTVDAVRQQGAIGRNIMNNSGTGDQVMESNIPRAQAEQRVEENPRLQNLDQRANSQTFQDDRHTRYDLNAEKGRLDVYTGYNLSFQPYKSQPTTATISSLSNIKSQLYISGNAIWDQYCAIHIRENDTANSREDIRENNEDNNNIRRDWMDNQSKQEQTGTLEINNISRIELEYRINDTTNNQADEEIGNGSINQTSAIDTVAIIPNHKKRGKADWTNPIYKSLIHMRKTSYHIYEPRDEQESKDSRMGQPDQVVEKINDRSGMVDIVNQEQQTEEHRNAQELSNINNGYISGEMGSNLINTGIGHTENIQTMESENPNIEQKRNNCNLIRTELFLA
ncbi:MAG: hypothetical protein EZS28_044098, partial [Streblomastix strix]